MIFLDDFFYDIYEDNAEGIDHPAKPALADDNENADESPEDENK